MVMIMMPKDDAIVLAEAVEIMESLPSQMRRDDQIMESLIESLQSGVPKLAARQDALEIAQLKLQETVVHGFSLVSNEIKEIDSIHNNYAQRLLMETNQLLRKHWSELKILQLVLFAPKKRLKVQRIYLNNHPDF